MGKAFGRTDGAGLQDRTGLRLVDDVYGFETDSYFI